MLQVSQWLLENVVHVILGCQLPTSHTLLWTFIQLTVKMVIKPNMGVMILKEKLWIINSFDRNSSQRFLATVHIASGLIVI